MSIQRYVDRLFDLPPTVATYLLLLIMVPLLFLATLLDAVADHRIGKGR